MWQLIGFIFTGILGTILHFLYDWSNQSIFVAPFSAVNESTWEHMKILFFPMLIFAFVQKYFQKKQSEDFWCVKLAGILLGLTTIPVLFYTYTGTFGVSLDWINITIFFLSAGAAFYLEWWLIKQEKRTCSSSSQALFMLFILVFVFVVFTFVPPQIPLFQDPITSGCIIPTQS